MAAAQVAAAQVAACPSCSPPENTVLEETVAFILRKNGRDPRYFNIPAIAAKLLEKFPLFAFPPHHPDDVRNTAERKAERKHFRSIVRGGLGGWEDKMSDLFDAIVGLVCPSFDYGDHSRNDLFDCDDFEFKDDGDRNPLYVHLAAMGHRLGILPSDAPSELMEYMA
jgi:hypothetical protein